MYMIGIIVYNDEDQQYQLMDLESRELEILAYQKEELEILGNIHQRLSKESVKIVGKYLS